jgi:hypothetical protein
MKHDFSKYEYALEDPKLAEVVNESCYYFGETVLVTHKAYALDKAWYKGAIGYQPSELPDVAIWFSSDELTYQ